MGNIAVYLFSLQSKIFKLLPMREALDEGEDNHLFQYIDNLLTELDGAMSCYPKLASESRIIEVHNNIAYLKTTNDVDFKKWRSLILRSTRLVNTLLSKYQEGGQRFAGSVETV